MSEKLRRIRVTDTDRNMAKELRKLRDSAGLSQPDVADYLGIKYQSYQRIEGGKAEFKADVIRRLAALFGVGPQHFFSDYSQAAIGWSPEVAKAMIIMIRAPFEDREGILGAMVKAKHGRAD